jgi:hypothetical protein
LKGDFTFDEFILVSEVMIWHVLISITQVVGAAEDHIPSLPSKAGIEIISYSKLLDQVECIILLCWN